MVSLKVRSSVRGVGSTISTMHAYDRRTSAEDLDRWLDRKGAVPATRSIEEIRAVVAGLGEPDPNNPWPLSDALAEMRAEES